MAKTCPAPPLESGATSHWGFQLSLRRVSGRLDMSRQRRAEIEDPDRGGVVVPFFRIQSLWDVCQKF